MIMKSRLDMNFDRVKLKLKVKLNCVVLVLQLVEYHQTKWNYNHILATENAPEI